MREGIRQLATSLTPLGWKSVATLALAALTLGCRGDSEKFFPVSGKVTAGGQIVNKGSVGFRADASKGNKTLHIPTGDIDPQGNYTLYTIGKSGAPPGWYKVVVTADSNPNPAPGVEPKWMHHAKYTNEGSTDVLLEVVENAPNGAYDLKLSK